MNIRLSILQIGVILLMSQLVACGSPSSPAAVSTAGPTSTTVAPTPVSASTAILVTTSTAQARPSLELVWEIGGDPDPFDTPVGVAVDAQGNIYVMDTNNFRVQKFDSEGNSLQMWGSEGSGDGQFLNDVLVLNEYEGHLAVDTQGNVYVLDPKNFRIQKFDSNGNYLTQWGTEGDGNGQFRQPFDITVDRENNIYVADVIKSTVQKFDKTGKFLLHWGKEGYNDGEFSTHGDLKLFSVAVVPDGNVLVTDATGRLQKFDSNGQFLSKVTPEPIDSEAISFWRIAVDNQGNIYIADWYNERIVKLDPEGKALVAWSGSDVGIDRFVSTTDIAVDEQGNIYLTDSTEDLVRKFRQPGFHP